MLSLSLSRQANKFLKKLPSKQAKQIASKIVELRLNPYPQDCISLKGYRYK
jgi:mRNA interferase RelE/StbE